ncbi:major facilitator superfamily domain-containing protein [Aspergillus californicus]
MSEIEKTTGSDVETKAGESVVYLDIEAEKSLVRKVDFYVLPLLCFSNLANAKTDGLEEDMHLKGNEYSLLILLFYIPFGLCDLPWNLLIKRYSGRIMLSFMTVIWGICAMCQCAPTSFGGLLSIRIILGIFEAGFFAGATYYFTLFYTRGEMGFRLAIMQSFAVLAAAFSGLISFGVFQINHPAVKGWEWLFIIEGAMTLITGVIGFWWLPDNAHTAWFLTDREKAAARARLLRDTSSEVETRLDIKAAFQTWTDWKFPLCHELLPAGTWPLPFPNKYKTNEQIVGRLGFSVIKTNLYTVAPNLVGAVILLCVAKSSDIFRERSIHIIFSLLVSLIGMLILASIDVAHNKAVSYFACFLLAAGAYIPSCLVHAWHNNNNCNENSRAANTGFFVGLGNIAGILSAATFRTEYAPKYIPTLVATCACNGVCIVATAFMGVWMRVENQRRDREQGVKLQAGQVDTSQLTAGEKSPEWRFFVMKKFPCEYHGCGKEFTRAEHLRRHSLNHENADNGFTCQRCFTHFSRPDLLSRHMMRHAKKDAEAGGTGKGVLETRKRTRRAEDGSIIVRPPKRMGRMKSGQAFSSSSVSVTSSLDHPPEGAPVSPPGSHGAPSALSVDDTDITDPDPMLAPMMPGPFEPFGEPIPGQFDAADGSWGAGFENDIFTMDTATDFNLPFAATQNYNWLFDVACLDDAFHQLEQPFGPDLPFVEMIDIPSDPMLNLDLDLDLNGFSGFDQDGSSVLLQAASFVERSNERRQEFAELDWMTGAPVIESSSVQPRISDDARRGILTLIAQSPPVDIHGQPLNLDSPLLALSALQNYSDLFFTRFNTTYPLIHTPTFNPDAIEPVFLAAILSMGATYCSREAHQLAVGIHDALRNQLFCNSAFSPQPDLWVLQAMLLIDCFGKMRAGPKQRERAQLFHCVLIKLIRRSTCCSIRSFCPDELSGKDESWRAAMDAEQRKRLAFQCFMWDTEHSVLFSQSLCMAAFEIRSSLPCSSAAWEAASAEEWSRHAREPEHTFLPVLKGYITPTAVTRPRDLNGFSRLVVLHGLMSISADLKRRDQTTLRAETPERVGAWTPRMGRAYDLWKADFDADCLSMKLGAPVLVEEAKRFTGLKSAAMALYRAASVALHVEILDLQIAAGASTILSRVVTQSDRDRSRNTLSRWLASPSATAATRHAAFLLQDAVLSLHDWDATDAFHFPWCLYLATLTIWVFHARDGLQRGRPTDLSSLIVAMTTCPGGELGMLGGQYETRTG